MLFLFFLEEKQFIVFAWILKFFLLTWKRIYGSKGSSIFLAMFMKKKIKNSFKILSRSF